MNVSIRIDSLFMNHDIYSWYKTCAHAIVLIVFLGLFMVEKINGKSEKFPLH